MDIVVDTTDRPPAFDAAVIRYIPALKALSVKIAAHHEREDLVADTLAYAFRAWRNFRLDDKGGYRGIYTWLTLNMRSILQTQNRRIKRPVFGGDAYEHACRRVGSPAGQLDAIIARQAISMLEGRDGEAVLRIAMGDSLEEVGISMGVCRERARQLGERGRARLARRIGRAHAV